MCTFRLAAQIRAAIDLAPDPSRAGSGKSQKRLRTSRSVTGRLRTAEVA